MIDQQFVLFLAAGVAVGASGFAVLHLLSLLGKTYHPETRQGWLYLCFATSYVLVLELSDLSLVTSGYQDLFYYLVITATAALSAACYKLYFTVYATYQYETSTAAENTQ